MERLNEQGESEQTRKIQNEAVSPDQGIRREKKMKILEHRSVTFLVRSPPIWIQRWRKLTHRVGKKLENKNIHVIILFAHRHVEGFGVGIKILQGLLQEDCEERDRLWAPN